MRNPLVGLVLLVASLALFTALAIAEDAPAPPAEQDEPAWTSLFDGKTLEGWKQSGYGGEKEALVEEGSIVLPMSEGLGGITYTGETPKTDYEVELEGKRVAGTDIFVGLAFPVGDAHASLVIGGWGGGVCGISSIDGKDANRNDTKKVLGFKKDQWYKVRLRVSADRIQVWLDDKPLIDADIKGKEVGIRRDIALSVPFGLATYTTTAHLRNIRIRPLAVD